MSEYLAIKNWEKYQSPRNTKNCPWIRSYTDREDDRDYMSLTIFQRYIIDACCRLRGRTGRNLHNDPAWISSALGILPQERRFVPKALQAIVKKGFLVPCDDAVTCVRTICKTPVSNASPVESTKESMRGEENRGEIEKEEDARTLPPLALAQKVAAELCLQGTGIIHSIAGAVQFCQKHEGKSPHAAVEFLIAQARDELDHGGAPNKFWFDDRKWRKHAPIATKSKMQESLDAINKL